MEMTLQLPLRLTLTALILVGSVFPAALKEDRNPSTTVGQSLPKNESNFLSANNTTIPEHLSKSANDKIVVSDKPSGEKLFANANGEPESAVKSANVESSKTDESSNKTEKDVPVNGKEESVELAKQYTTDDKSINVTNKDVKQDNVNSTTGEQSDLLTSNVSPHDDDDDDDQATTISEATLKSETDGESTVVAPVVSNDKKDEVTTPKISQPTPNPAPKETIHLTNGSIEASHKDEVNRTELLSNSTTSAMIHPAQPVQSESRTKSEESGENGMPASIIALIIAITFAVALAIAYVSVIAWRRYLEYRYGHRELLVNDLEFDTNDLRHFEL